MRENIAEGLLIILDSLGLKAISTEEVVLHFIVTASVGDTSPALGAQTQRHKPKSVQTLLSGL